MGLFGKSKKEITEPIITPEEKMSEAYDVRMQASLMSDAMSMFFGNAFTGQTISGGMDFPEVTTLDYYTLRERSWSAMAKDELASIIVRRLVLFVAGTGLKLQCEPMFTYLSNFGVNFTDEEKLNFVRFIEDSYKLQSGSKIMSDISKEKTLPKIMSTAFYNALIGGDCLIIQNVVDGYPKIKLIDGANIVDPSMLDTKTSDSISIASENGGTKTRKIPKGNRIIDGVEIDTRGCHVGYYVNQTLDSPAIIKQIQEFNTAPVFVPAYGDKTGRRTAWLFYRNQYRLGETRGMPMLGVVLEKAQLLRRYSRAEVLNAELSAKILAFIEHGEGSTGLNPMRAKVISRNRDGLAPVIEQGPSAYTGDQIATNFAKVTGGQMINLGRNQKINKFDTARPSANFGEFYDSNAKYICAALDVPWEVALMLFSNNFSASRMASKLFEGGALAYWRQELSDNLYRPHYNLFFAITVLRNENMRVPKYFEGLRNQDHMIINAYTNARFIGKAMPHVDPLKEVNAIKVAKEEDIRAMTPMVEETFGEDYEDTVPMIAKERELLKRFNISSAETAEDKNI